ncbi:hypothetical protein LR013_04890 [candidate division NPL-UPA2 bacterium]|nr:hypothetical protein [candidate division NPL-UPA2 bacterium]
MERKGDKVHPHLDLASLPITPLAKLERIRKIGFETGLRYVYPGNVPGHPGENTHCYRCKELLIAREEFRITEFYIKGARCPRCRVAIGSRVAA